VLARPPSKAGLAGASGMPGISASALSTPAV
jgi:hypothetical protein